MNATLRTCILIGLTLVPAFEAACGQVVARHVVVYHEPGRYGGWPANNGIWNWDDEILVSFGRGWSQEKADNHSVARDLPSQVVFARSLDGGESWKLEVPDSSFSGTGELPPSPGGIDFSHPDLALRIRNEALWFSYDRGRTWKGPFLIPEFGHGALTSRTDYIVKSKDECLFFFSSKDLTVQVDGDELKDRAFCARTTDGGKTFEFVGWMGDEPLTVRSVMPSTVRAADGTLVTTMRRRYDIPTAYRNDMSWVDAYGSANEGRTWNFLARLGYTDTALHNGNPPSLVKLPDGRIAAAWGVRSDPFGIHGRASSDNGRTWGPELVLRDDGRKYDLGYCQSVVRKDGRVVTLYYYSTRQRTENHIEATIWSPPSE